MGRSSKAPSLSRQCAILRAPHAGWASRLASTALPYMHRCAWARVRPSRTIRQVVIIGSRPRQPFVANIGADPEPPAQLPPVHILWHRKPDKLPPLIITDTSFHRMQGTL